MNKEIFDIVSSYIRKHFSDIITEKINYIKEGKITINCTKRFNSFKIYNMLKGSMCLIGIELYKNGTLLDKLPSYTYSTGELRKINSKNNLLLNTKYKPYMLLTVAALKHCWLEFSFKEPVDADTIVIYGKTRKGWYRKILSIGVNISFEDGSTEKAVDEITIINGYAKIVAEQLYPIYNEYANMEQIKYVAGACFRMIFEMFYDFNPFYFEAVEAGVDQVAMLNFVNASLRDFKLHFSPGYRFLKSFEFWSDKEKFDYLNSAAQVVAMLREKNPRTFFGAGTLLGFVREKDGFIPHDHDIDVFCIFSAKEYETHRQGYEELIAYLTAKGVVVTHLSKNCLHVKYNNQPMFDIFIGLEDENGYISYPWSWGEKQNTAYLFPTIDINIMDIQCPIPKNPFTYLDTGYGKNWRTPIDKNFAFQQK